VASVSSAAEIFDGLDVALRNTKAVVMDAANLRNCIKLIFGCSNFEIFQRFAVLLSDSVTVLVIDTQIIIGDGVAFVSSAAKVFERFRVVFANTEHRTIEIPKIAKSVQVIAVGANFVIAERFGVALGNALPDLELAAKQKR
jgi:hypothetical protein